MPRAKDFFSWKRYAYAPPVIAGVFTVMLFLAFPLFFQIKPHLFSPGDQRETRAYLVPAQIYAPYVTRMGAHILIHPESTRTAFEPANAIPLNAPPPIHALEIALPQPDSARFSESTPHAFSPYFRRRLAPVQPLPKKLRAPFMYHPRFGRIPLGATELGIEPRLLLETLPSKMTRLQYFDSEIPGDKGGLPRVRLLKSCGQPVLDRLAASYARTLTDSAKAKPESGDCLDFCWNEESVPAGLEKSLNTTPDSLLAPLILPGEYLCL